MESTQSWNTSTIGTAAYLSVGRPKEAAATWLGVPEGGLSAMTPAQRRALAQHLTVTLEEGEGKESRVLDIRDKGIGISPENMPRTILSLNESNKLSKHYLVGAYGQGGSSTFTFSKLSLIACRSEDSLVGFTIVKFQDLPAAEFKTGHYVYMVTAEGSMPTIDLPLDDFPRGTQVRHFGYDLNSYGSPIGPNSLYGSMNTNLFDPVMPIWFDNRVRDFRRVIKGSRNALNGAVDEGDDGRGPELSHSNPMFTVSLGDFGRIGIEYWVLETPTSKNKRPSGSFVNPAKPIILTLNGQNQGELSQIVIRKEAESAISGQSPYRPHRLRHSQPDLKAVPLCIEPGNAARSQSPQANPGRTREGTEI